MINSLEDTERGSFILHWRNYIDPLLNNEYQIGNKSMPICNILSSRNSPKFFFQRESNLFARDTTMGEIIFFFFSLIFFLAHISFSFVKYSDKWNGEYFANEGNSMVLISMWNCIYYGINPLLSTTNSLIIFNPRSSILIP